IPPADLLQRNAAALARLRFVLALDQAEFVDAAGVIDLVATPEPMLLLGGRGNLFSLRLDLVEGLRIRGGVAQVLHMFAEGVVRGGLAGSRGRCSGQRQT